jgi:transketolase
MAFGVREHAMGAAVNGMALHGGVLPFSATFFVFSDYMKPAVRLGAISKLKVFYVFTHDSIGVGEDGPTHEPVEQLAGLRAIPGLTLIRPADSNETVDAWTFAMRHDGPTAIVLTRQNVPHLDRSGAKSPGVARGAYILRDTAGTPDIILIGTGSEVSLCVEACDKLAAQGIKARVVSMPSMSLFEAQPPEYREAVLPRAVRKRVTVEAGATFGWDRYAGESGKMIGLNRYGASAKGEVVFANLGITAEAVVKAATEF